MSSFLVPWNSPSFFGHPGDTPSPTTLGNDCPVWIIAVGVFHPPSNQTSCYPTSVREKSLTEKGSSDYFFFFFFGNDHSTSTPYGVYSVLRTYTFITLKHTQPWIVELRSTSSFDDIQLPNTFPRGPLVRLTLVLCTEYSVLSRLRSVLRSRLQDFHRCRS